MYSLWVKQLSTSPGKGKCFHKPMGTLGEDAHLENSAEPALRTRQTDNLCFIPHQKQLPSTASTH